MTVTDIAAPRRHHLDRRADDIIAQHLADMDPAILLDPPTVSKILAVAQTTLENWRVRGCGPDYVKLGPRMCRYPAGKLLAWLRGRSKVPEYGADIAPPKNKGVKGGGRPRKQEPKQPQA